VITHKIQDLKLLFEACYCISSQPKACRYIKSVYLSVEIFGKQETSGNIVLIVVLDISSSSLIIVSSKLKIICGLCDSTPGLK